MKQLLTAYIALCVALQTLTFFQFASSGYQQATKLWQITQTLNSLNPLK